MIDDLRRRLAEGERVTVTGPAGSGRTRLLTAVAAELRPVWTLTPAEADREVPFGALAELLMPLDRPESAAQRRAVETVLGSGEPDPRALRLALLGLLTSGTLVVDDAQWLDPPSRAVLGYLARLAGPGLGVLASVRSGDPILPGTTATALEPLDPAQTAVLLESHGMPYRLAGKIHAAAGGNPRLVLAIGAAAAADGDPSTFDAATLTPDVLSAARSMLAPLTGDQRTTLLMAALADRPGIRLLRRAGVRTAHQDIAAAASAGLAYTGADGQISLRPGVLGPVLVHDADPVRVSDCHRALATAADDELGRLWHASAVDDVPDAAIASALGAASSAELAHGRPARAAELALRAAARATTEIPSGTVSGWLIEAARAAGAAGRTDLARAAVHLLEQVGAPPADRARARLTMADAAGQALDGLDETLARALIEARDDHGLLAAIRLRLAWRANLSEGSPVNAREHAVEAAHHAHEAGDGPTEALALTQLARMQRILGDGEAETTLARALALPATPAAYGLHNSPRYLALRHAYFDDRLEEARTGLLAMLPVAEASGIGEDVVDILRFLAEVEIRAGRCQVGLARAERAVRVGEQAGLSAGPSCYTAAVAELAAGSPQQARAYADRAIAASHEEHDQVYLARAFHISGLISLAGRDATAAARELRQTQRLEHDQVHDPSLLRWHGDLAEALVGTGEPESAYQLIVRTRRIATRLDRPGVLAALDRAEGVYRSATGETAHAVALLRRSQDQYARLGQPLERGRSLIALAVAERRRRRRAAARDTQQLAEEVFLAVGARVWAATADPVKEPEALSPAEARIVELATAGASNREIAAALFLSVKTVEAALTRVYRRTGVRSRAQLHSLFKS